MEGKYGPYVSDGTTHATLPKGSDPKAVTLDEAIALIDEKAAKGQRRRRPQAGAEEVQGSRSLQRLPHGQGLPAPAYATEGVAGLDVVAAVI
jgi:topoisomerase IA-like protein